VSYTQPIFTPNLRYRVKQTFSSGPTSTFIAGEILVFERDAYSHYDNNFVYVFRAEGDGQTKEWWLPEGQPKAAWREYFEPAK